MTENAKWMKHATSQELSELVNLMLTASRHTKALVARRQLIRDRCYARARRDEAASAWRRALGSDGWIKWAGGKCPVPPSTMVLFRVPLEIARLLAGRDSGITGDIPRRADSLNWERRELDDNRSTDIVAYKVIVDARRSEVKEG